MNQQALSALIWSVADLPRGDYKQSEYGRVILPFTVLRRLDCVLAKTKEARASTPNPFCCVRPSCASSIPRPWT